VGLELRRTCLGSVLVGGMNAGHVRLVEEGCYQRREGLIIEGRGRAEKTGVRGGGGVGNRLGVAAARAGQLEGGREGWP